MTERAAPTRLPGDALRRRFLDVRTHSTALAAPLSAEDQALQSMPDASPTKWHLAHTTWFFETVVLARHARGYTPFDAHYAYLFNSYYEALGPRHARPQRGLLSRPSLDEVRRYREHVDAALLRLLDDTPEGARGAFAAEIELGLHHEQQHQELILTDILHAFSLNPLLPAYRAVEVGDAGRGFAFDNERPRHPVLLQPYSIGNRLVTNGEYADFIADDGYARPELWLSDGWATVQREAWRAPLYWQPGDMRGDWLVFGLGGAHALDRTAPVAHLSFYEAAAYAEWAQARLPTEFEWEAASILPGIAQVSDSVWQWTRSAYAPYPGFRPLPGIAAEYNGKFMVGQQVLRGGSVATPSGHARPTYRNFFPPAARWQFSGVRLAKDA